MPFKAVVVSTGGGAVVRAQNWGLMQHGVVVWLRGEPELLARRALRDGIASRPMLVGAGGAGGGEEVGGLGRLLAKSGSVPCQWTQHDPSSHHICTQGGGAEEVGSVTGQGQSCPARWAG